MEDEVEDEKVEDDDVEKEEDNDVEEDDVEEDDEPILLRDFHIFLIVRSCTKLLFCTG